MNLRAILDVELSNQDFWISASNYTISTAEQASCLTLHMESALQDANSLEDAGNLELMTFPNTDWSELPV